MGTKHKVSRKTGNNALRAQQIFASRKRRREERKREKLRLKTERKQTSPPPPPPPKKDPAPTDEPTECTCGGKYTPDTTWPSRMICNKCGDYYDKSGPPKPEQVKPEQEAP